MVFGYVSTAGSDIRQRILPFCSQKSKKNLRGALPRTPGHTPWTQLFTVPHFYASVIGSATHLMSHVSSCSRALPARCGPSHLANPLIRPACAFGARVAVPSPCYKHTLASCVYSNGNAETQSRSAFLPVTGRGVELHAAVDAHAKLGRELVDNRSDCARQRSQAW